MIILSGLAALGGVYLFGLLAFVIVENLNERNRVGKIRPRRLKGTREWREQHGVGKSK